MDQDILSGIPLQIMSLFLDAAEVNGEKRG